MGPLNNDLAFHKEKCLATQNPTVCRALSAERHNAEYNALERWVCDWARRMCKMLEQRCTTIKHQRYKDEMPSALQAFLQEIEGGSSKARRPLAATDALQRVEVAMQLALNLNKPQSPRNPPTLVASPRQCGSREVTGLVLKRQTAQLLKDQAPQLGVPRPKGPTTLGYPDIGGTQQPRLPGRQQSMQRELPNRDTVDCIEHRLQPSPEIKDTALTKAVSKRTRRGESLSDLFSSSESESEQPILYSFAEPSKQQVEAAMQQKFE